MLPFTDFLCMPNSSRLIEGRNQVSSFIRVSCSIRVSSFMNSEIIVDASLETQTTLMPPAPCQIQARPIKEPAHRNALQKHRVVPDQSPLNQYWRSDQSSSPKGFSESRRHSRHPLYHSPHLSCRSEPRNYSSLHSMRFCL